MNNNIEYIIHAIRQEIPPELLTAGFKKFTNGGLLTEDTVIHDKIVTNVVLRDCNLFNGKIKQIELKSEHAQQVISEATVVGTYSLYIIPPEDRDFQDIYYALTVSYPYAVGYAPYISVGSPKDMGSIANDVIDSMTGYGGYIAPRAVVRDSNVIELKPPQLDHINWIVSCMIGYDQGFSNVSPSVVRSLADMAIAATKRWLYTNLVIKMNSGILMGGEELGKFSDILENYSNANEEYEEALTDFRGASMFDQDKMLDMIGMMM